MAKCKEHTFYSSEYFNGSYFSAKAEGDEWTDAFLLLRCIECDTIITMRGEKINQ